MSDYSIIQGDFICINLIHIYVCISINPVLLLYIPLYPSTVSIPHLEISPHGYY